MDLVALMGILKEIAPTAFIQIEPYLRKKPKADELILMLFAVTMEHHTQEQEFWDQTRISFKRDNEMLVTILERTKNL